MNGYNLSTQLDVFNLLNGNAVLGVRSFNYGVAGYLRAVRGAAGPSLQGERDADVLNEGFGFARIGEEAVMRWSKMKPLLWPGRDRSGRCRCV